MEIVLLIDVTLPGDILDFKGGLRDTTDEALVLNFRFDKCFASSLVGKGINNDTEEDVHQDNVDDHEEQEVVNIP